MSAPIGHAASEKEKLWNAQDQAGSIFGHYTAAPARWL